MLNVKFCSLVKWSLLALCLSISFLLIHLPATFSAPGWIMSFHVLITERSVCWVLSPLAHSTLVPWISEDCCARLHVLCILLWLVFYHSSISFLPSSSPVAFSLLAALWFSGSLNRSGSRLRIVLDYGAHQRSYCKVPCYFADIVGLSVFQLFPTSLLRTLIFSTLGFVNGFLHDSLRVQWRPSSLYIFIGTKALMFSYKKCILYKCINIYF